MEYKKNITYKSLKTFGFDKPKHPTFYELSIGNEGNYAYPIPVKKKTPKSLMECSLCDGIERRVLGTSTFLFEGTKEADVYHHPRYVITGEKVQNILSNNDIIGYKVCKINIQDSSKLSEKHLQELKEIEIIGRCYRIHSIDGDVIKHCPVCKKVDDSERIKADKGIKIIDEFWDGSDIFMFDYGLLSIIVTDKVKKLFEENNVSNVTFIPLEELTMR